MNGIAKLCLCLTALLSAVFSGTPECIAADALDEFLFANTNEMRWQYQTSLPATPRTYWLGDPEVRLKPEVNATDLWTGTYSLRFRPVGGKERSTARKLFAIENQLASVDWDRALGQALATRYHRVIELAEQEARLAHAVKDLQLQRLLLTSEQALAAGAGYSASRLQTMALRLELGEQDVERLRHEVQQTRTATVASYLSATPGEQPAVSGRIIQPATIAALLPDLSGKALSSSTTSTRAALEVVRADHEVTLERSRSGFGINLLEFGVEDKVTDSYSITVGFRLPFGQTQTSGQRRLRTFYAAKQHAALTEQLLADAIDDLVRAAMRQTGAHAQTSAALAGIDERIQSTTGDASVIAALRKHQLDLSELALRSHIEALHDYIDLLELAGLLQQPPLTNWLRRNHP